MSEPERVGDILARMRETDPVIAKAWAMAQTQALGAEQEASE